MENEISEKELENLINNCSIIKGLSHYNNKNQNKKNNNKYYYNYNNYFWFPLKNFQKLTPNQMNEIYNKFNIDVRGDNYKNIPPIFSFKIMKFPAPILKYLEKKDIKYPSPNQMITIPFILSRRNIINIELNNYKSKNLTFLFPLIMFLFNSIILNNDNNLIGIIISPSREVAIEIDNQLNNILKYFYKNNNFFPIIKSVLLIGGVDIKYQIIEINRGCNLIIATPGRLNEIFEKKIINLTNIKILIINQTEKLININFEEDIFNICKKITKFNYNNNNLQICLFFTILSNEFCKVFQRILNKPILIKNKNLFNFNKIKQNFEIIDNDNKMLLILNLLNKTPPPVLIFCENKTEVETITEYFLLKGIKACFLHGELNENNRIKILREFNNNLKDVLISTDFINKGINFEIKINHVINFDFPLEIENYILRLEKSNYLVTTFINKNIDEAILNDLKYFLNFEINKNDYIHLVECPFCGWYGHNLNQCHKFENQRKKTLQSTDQILISNNNFFN